MKYLRSKFTVLVLASLVFLTSCSQYDSFSEESPNLSTIDYTELSRSSNYNKHDRILTDEDITQIAIGHNQQLSLLFINNPQTINDVNDRVLELYSDKGLTREILFNYENEVNNMNTKTLTDLIDLSRADFVNSELLIKRLEEIRDINDVNDLKIHEAQVRTELRGLDLDTYLVVSNVYQHSLIFWQIKYPDTPNETQGDWKEADGISAAIGFLTMAAAFAAISAFTVATGGTGVVATVAIVAGLLEISAQSAIASVVEAFK
jgi:hypothetical protein